MAKASRTTLKVAGGGRIVIPAEIRQRLGLEVGSEIVLTVQDDQATLMNAKVARRRAQQRVRRYAGPGVNLSRELMSERKKDAAVE